MNKIEIEIPNDKEIDWEASAKQKQIVFKDKQLTYEDVCEKLFNKGHYFIQTKGEIGYLNFAGFDANSASTKHQLECILAKNKLANCARYLNDDWEPGKTVLGHFNAYVLYVTSNKNYIGCIKIQECAHNSNVLFKSQELAQQAIKILGEDTIKLALEPLY